MKENNLNTNRKATEMTEKELKKELEIFGEIVCDILKPHGFDYSYVEKIVEWHERGRNEAIKASQDEISRLRSELDKANEQIKYYREHTVASTMYIDTVRKEEWNKAIIECSKIILPQIDSPHIRSLIELVIQNLGK